MYNVYIDGLLLFSISSDELENPRNYKTREIAKYRENGAEVEVVLDDFWNSLGE